LDVREIVDQKSFEAWLEALPEERRYEWAVTLATRAALRVFPFWGAAMLRDMARRRNWTVLPICRNVLISAVAVKIRTANIRRAADTSVDAADAAITVEPSIGSGGGTTDDALSAASAAIFTAEAATDTGVAVDAALAIGNADLLRWAVLRADILELEQGFDLRTLPLWSEDMPADIAEAWEKGRAWMEAAPGHAFWIRWYEAILAGRPLTQDWDSHWQLMHDIALVPDEDWGEGKEQDAIGVARIIDLITQKHALQQEVARAKRALENETYNAMTLGQHSHNLPDDLPPSRVVQYRRHLREVQEELEAVEAALQPPIPDAALLEEVTGRLSAAWERLKVTARAIGVGVVAGVTIYVSAAIGQAGVRGMDWLLDHGMPQLIRGLKDTAPKPSTPPKASKGWERPSVDT